MALAIIQGIDNVLIIGNKSLRKRLGIDGMEGLESAALHGLEQNAGVSEEEVAIMATMAKEYLEAGELLVRQVAVSMKSFSASQELAARLRE